MERQPILNTEPSRERLNIIYQQLKKTYIRYGKIIPKQDELKQRAIVWEEDLRAVPDDDLESAFTSAFNNHQSKYQDKRMFNAAELVQIYRQYNYTKMIMTQQKGCKFCQDDLPGFRLVFKWVGPLAQDCRPLMALCSCDSAKQYININSSKREPIVRASKLLQRDEYMSLKDYRALPNEKKIDPGIQAILDGLMS